tara:strand:- start:124 stop:855 length:732 start_codon:yes stop_codon:yes gene_type:complete
MKKKGYVYIARIIDHGGKFVSGYHKIGLSKQYKVRETQLNSTHLPFDVLMIRVFPTDDMEKLEGILHVCFTDYRVVKEYDDRKNITTEWFDVSDVDEFNERFDKVTDLMDIEELDLGTSIDNDKTLTIEEKIETKENIGRAKSTKLKITMGNKIFSENTAKDTFVNFINEITIDVDPKILLDSLSSLFKKTQKEFSDSVPESQIILMDNGLYLSTYLRNTGKINKIKRVCDLLNIENVECELI